MRNTRSEIRDRVAFNVRRRRWELGMTPGELAARCHWRRATIHRIEQGLAYLLLQHMETLSIALDCTEEDLCQKA
jgi:DNA-binding XRE family transcriptional regulator